MGKADAKYNIRKEYQALYGIGLVLAVFASAQMVGGDGFLAAFFAGLAITLFNVTLCDCFREYGETTSEMLMLLAFVLFGAVLSVLLREIPLAMPLLLAVLAIFVVRPAALFVVLQRARMSNVARLFIGWFGPRGLNSLLLALLAVQASVPDAEWMLAVVGVVVTVSVVVHGTTATPLSAWYGRRVATTVPTLEEEREATFTGLFEADTPSLTFVTPEALHEQLASEIPPVVLDVRARARYEMDEGQIPRSTRVLPDRILDWLPNRPPNVPIVVYCSCPDDGTSIRVVRQLNELGVPASVLQGGYDSWRAQYPLEPKMGESSPPGEPIALT
jgi:rhodanese-related sulfurtransferase